MIGHRCVLAIVGSRTLDGNPHVYSAIADAIEIHVPATVISGGAVGVDSMAEEVAWQLGFVTAIYEPTVKRWDGPGGYKERNALIAKSCDHLVCIYDIDSETRGSSWTADLAERSGKDVTWIAIQRS